MSYFQELDRWLDELGEEFGISAGLRPEGWADFKHELKDKTLESYRNGQNAGPRPQTETAPRTPDSRKLDRFPRRSTIKRKA